MQMQGTSTHEPVTWKKFHGEMVNKMRIQKLKEALKRRERVQMEVAVKEAKAAGVTSDHPLMAEVEMELDVINVREELLNAVGEKDPVQIRQVMEKILSERFYHTRLQPNLAEARRELDRLERMYRLSSYILDMDKKMMGEMRRYHHPPAKVHQVMKAILLLFKRDEETSEKWTVCQQFLQPNGSNGMNRRILDFDVNNVHPEIGARVNEILDKYELNKIQEVSSGAATFYVWAKGVIEEMGPSIKVKPADVKRQKELFAPPLPISPRRRRKGTPYDDPSMSPRKN